nr:hypothetical protein [Tanacetum cinerariifolium]
MDNSDEDLLEAAESLMNFANGHRSSVIEGSNSNANSPPSIDKGKEVVMQVEDQESKEVQMELDDHESDSRNSDEKQLVITYKRRRMKLMNELELESGSDGKWSNTIKGLFSMDKVTENCVKEDSLMMVGSSTLMAIKLKIPKEGKRVCSVCKKEFSLGNAFAGHMRVHVMYHKNGPFKTGSKLFKKIGDNQYLSGSANVTERQGRRSLKMDDTDEDLLEAAEALMSLEYGHRSSVIEGSNSNANLPPSIDKGKAVVMQVVDHESKEVQMELDDHESDSRNSDEKQLVITYKRKRMKLMNELELESGSDEFKFRCTTCNKCFISYQALGGHRSSRNRAAKKIKLDDHFVGENVAKEDEFAVLHFDLNEVPAIMMEDEGGDANANVNGNGYASSSYNSNI